MSEFVKTSEMVEQTLPTPVEFAGIQIHPLRFDEAVDSLMALASREGHDFVITVNVDHVVRLTRCPELRDLYATADLVVADGMPLVWASRMLGKPLPERVAGSDLFPALCDRAAKEGRSVFFLGGAKGAAQRAAEILVRQHPALKIAGTCCPDFGFEKDPKQASQVLDEVRDARPDILFVGLGSPSRSNGSPGTESSRARNSASASASVSALSPVTSSGRRVGCNGSDWNGATVSYRSLVDSGSGILSMTWLFSESSSGSSSNRAGDVRA